MKMLVGLGNPGEEYHQTRHNLGWDAVHAFAEMHGADKPSTKTEWKASVAMATLDDERMLCVWPLTYMNLSGESVQAIAHYYKILPTDILIVHDEMDYALGIFAFTAQGRPAGHNGVSSIQGRMATTAIPRLRLGIGRPLPPIKKEDFVLQAFSKEERKIVHDVLDRSVKAMTDWIKLGTDKAMNTWNQR